MPRSGCTVLYVRPVASSRITARNRGWGEDRRSVPARDSATSRVTNRAKMVFMSSMNAVTRPVDVS
jgi:hypothetical protein